MGAGHIPTFVHTKLPLTGVSFLRHLRRLPGALCFLAPVLVEDALRESPADYEILKTTKRIFTGGAALDKTAGKRLIEMGVPIVQVYGTLVSFDKLRERERELMCISWFIGQKLVCLFTPTFLDLPRRDLKTCLTCIFAMTNLFSTGSHLTTSSVN